MANFVEQTSELIRCFDDQGNEVQPRPRAEIHQKPFNTWHATTAIYVINKEGELLCSKRSNNHSYRPGQWQGCFGGHVQAGESYEQNAAKELSEEAGIKAGADNLHFLMQADYPHSMHCARLFAYLFDGDLKDIHCDDGEISEVKWRDMGQFWREENRLGNIGTSACPPEVQEKIKVWLKNLSAIVSIQKISR
ncbi:MAG: NUDIX domain-containing protein [Patescibacteria group bacterium]|nr:NUDIX domain-containing protein [Patescibacteria group bacterium]